MAKNGNRIKFYWFWKKPPPRPPLPSRGAGRRRHVPGSGGGAAGLFRRRAVTGGRGRKPEGCGEGVPRSRERRARRRGLRRVRPRPPGGDDRVQAGGGGSRRRRQERADHPAHPEPLRGRVRPHHRGERRGAAGAAARAPCGPRREAGAGAFAFFFFPLRGQKWAYKVGNSGEPLPKAAGTFCCSLSRGE